jgi:hypothetical protein
VRSPAVRAGWWIRRWRPGSRIVEYHFVERWNGEGELPSLRSVCRGFLARKVPDRPPAPWTHALSGVGSRLACQACIAELDR